MSLTGCRYPLYGDVSARQKKYPPPTAKRMAKKRMVKSD